MLLHAVAEEQDDDENKEMKTAITFDETAEKINHPKMDSALYIPGPRERDSGHPLVELKKEFRDSQDGKQHQSYWF